MMSVKLGLWLLFPEGNVNNERNPASCPLSDIAFINKKPQVVSVKKP